MTAAQDRVASWRAFLRSRGSPWHDCAHVASMWSAYDMERTALVHETEDVLIQAGGAELSTGELAEMLRAPWSDMEWALGVVEAFGVAVARFDDSELPSKMMWRRSETVNG